MTSQRIDIPNWYQIDFGISIARATLQNIYKLIKELRKQNLIDRWFYLFEFNTIRVRFHSLKYQELEKELISIASRLGLTISSQHKFEKYWETTEVFSSIDVAKAFANIMSILTELTITRLDKTGGFSNYDLAERLSHCIFNNVYGSDTELYFLLKRLGVNFQLNDNPEQTVLDEKQKYQLTNPASIKISAITIPINIENKNIQSYKT